MFRLIVIVFISFSLRSGSDYQVYINLEVGGVSQVTVAMRLSPSAERPASRREAPPRSRGPDSDRQMAHPITCQVFLFFFFREWPAPIQTVSRGRLLPDGGVETKHLAWRRVGLGYGGG